MAYYADGQLVGGGGGGRGGSIGDYQGQFNATTVRQRAFDADDYIVFDNGTKLVVYLAPVDIPINSPAPGQAGALWGELDTTVTSGLSDSDLTARLRNYTLASAFGDAVNNINTSLNGKVDATDFHTALGTKADTDALTDYLRTATYNLDKARLESGITGNDNDISQLMTALQALQTTVNNLPSGGGEGGGGVSTAALNTAINNLRTALQASIDAKQDASTAATDEELATAVGTLRSTLQANIDTLTTQVGNIPITSDVLWATSKVLTSGNVPSGSTIDTDWTLGDDAATGVTVSGDVIKIPESFRGDLHVDFEASDGNLLQRLIVPLSLGIRDGYGGLFPVQFQTRVSHDSSDNTLLNFQLYMRGGAARPIGTPSGAVAKVYGVSALPRSQVVGITQAQLDAATEKVDSKFGGVPLNGPDAGETLSHVRIINFNKFIPEANWATVPVFSGVNLLRDPIPAGASFKDLVQYDRLLIRITFYLGEIASARRSESSDFFVNVAEWNSLKTVPLPDQAIAESATDRIQIIASTKDNRALVHEFPQVAPADVSAENALRNSKRLIYVGKSNETNPRLLIALSGTNQDFLVEVRGYH